MPRWVELGSEEAIRTKEDCGEELKRQLERAEQDRRRKEERERQRLALFDGAFAGDPADWTEFVLDRRGDCQWDKVGLVEGIFTLSTLVEEQKGQLLRSAKRYLLTCSFAAEQRVRCQVGYLSLRLLQSTGSEGAELASCVLEWTSAIVYWNTLYLHRESDAEPHRALLRMAFDCSNAEASAALRVVLRGQLNREWPPGIFEYLPPDTSVGEVLIEFLNGHTYFPRTRNVIAGLLRLQRAQAFEWAKSELGASALTSIASRRTAQIWSCVRHRKGRGRYGRWGTRAAVANHRVRRADIVPALLAEGRSDSWKIAWAECQRDPLVAARVLPNVVGRLERDTWGLDLTVQQVAAYYDWLESHVPIDRTASDFSEDRMLRQTSLGRLSTSGTSESVALVRELSGKHPDNVAVKVVLPQVLDLKRERSWQPLELGELEALMDSPDRRLIRSDEQLLDVVVETLSVLQAMVRRETPAVARFWSTRVVSRRKVYSPKDEGDLSDELAIFLRERLGNVVVGGAVVVNREVEIRPGDADRPGEKLDLLVQAMGQSDSGRLLQVAIEVKGSWNAEIETAIESQLRIRYLANGDLRCGIYLAGWFECTNWDPLDESRQAASQCHTKVGLGQRLAATARTLETDRRRVRAVVLDLTMGKSSKTTGGKDSA